MGIVAKRSSMTFYSDPTCHYSHRVRIVLAEKGVTVDIVDVDNLAIPEEVLTINPYGTLPTLIDRELALYETKVMMEYLDERFPHPPLLPVYPVARALSRQFIHRIEKDCSSQIDIIIRSSDIQIIENARKELQDSLISLAPIFADLP
jgi:RNA polymerase-associated protein